MPRGLLLALCFCAGTRLAFAYDCSGMTDTWNPGWGSDPTTRCAEWANNAEWGAKQIESANCQTWFPACGLTCCHLFGKGEPADCSGYTDTWTPDWGDGFKGSDDACNQWARADWGVAKIDMMKCEDENFAAKSCPKACCERFGGFQRTEFKNFFKKATKLGKDVLKESGVWCRGFGKGDYIPNPEIGLQLIGDFPRWSATIKSITCNAPTDWGIGYLGGVNRDTTLVTLECVGGKASPPKFQMETSGWETYTKGRTVSRHKAYSPFMDLAEVFTGGGKYEENAYCGVQTVFECPKGADLKVKLVENDDGFNDNDVAVATIPYSQMEMMTHGSETVLEMYPEDNGYWTTFWDAFWDGTGGVCLTDLAMFVPGGAAASKGLKMSKASIKTIKALQKKAAKGVQKWKKVQGMLDTCAAITDISQAGTSFLTFGIGKLRPKLEPKLQEHGLEWEDVKPALEMVDSYDELVAAKEDPYTFLTNLAKVSQPIAVKFALAKLRPKLEPKLKAMGLDWTVVYPLVNKLDTVEEIENAINDPEQFLEQLANSYIQVAIAQARPKIEPTVQKQGLAWDDVLPAFELIDTVAEIKEAATDPEAFLKKVAVTAGNIGIKFAIAKARPAVEPKAKKIGLTWDDMTPVLNEISTVEKLQEAYNDPQGFLDRLATQAGNVALKWAIAQSRPYLEPIFKAQGLSWDDALLVLNEVDEVQDLKDAQSDPDAFLDKMKTKSAQVALKLLFVKVKAKLTPELKKHGLDWVDVDKAIEQIDTVEKLQEIYDNPAAWMAEQAKKPEASTQENTNPCGEASDMMSTIWDKQCVKPPQPQPYIVKIAFHFDPDNIALKYTAEISGASPASAIGNVAMLIATIVAAASFA